MGPEGAPQPKPEKPLTSAEKAVITGALKGMEAEQRQIAAEEAARAAEKSAVEVPPAPLPESVPPMPPTPETTPPPFLQKPEPPSAEQLAAIEKERAAKPIPPSPEAPPVAPVQPKTETKQGVEVSEEVKKKEKEYEDQTYKIAKDLRVLWDKIPESLKGSAEFFEAAEAMRKSGSLNQFIQGSFEFYDTTQPQDPSWGRFHILEQFQRLREKAVSTVGPDAEKILKEAEAREQAEYEKRVGVGEESYLDYAAKKLGLEKQFLRAEELFGKGAEGVEKLAEKFGIKKETIDTTKRILGTVASGAINTLGSIFGARSAWEVPKAVIGFFKKREQRGKISGATLSLLETVQARKKELPEGVEELVESPVQAKIRALNESLKEAKMPAKEKSALRKEMAQIFKDYRKEGKNLDEAKTEKVGKVLDLYINNSAQTALATREALNTVTIGIGLPGLRALGYTALAGAERIMKAADDYEKTHIAKEGKRVEKLQAVGEDLYKAAITETFDGLIGNFFKKEKPRVQKGVEFVSAVGKLFRIAGLAEFEYQLQTGSLTMQEGAQKLFVAIGEGRLKDALMQGGENWVNNAQRLLSYIGLSENPDEAARKLMQAKEAEVAGAMEKGQAAAAARLGVEQARVAGMAEAERAAAEAAALEKMKELATIGKGEGVTHALTRQLENNPAAFGFAGNQDNATEVHRWAARRAYELAVQNKYINSQTGEEVRVLFDAKNPSQYLLNPDGTVREVDSHEYTWNPTTETKAALASVQEQTIHTRAVLEGRRVAEAEVERIYRVFPFRHRPEEWEVHRGLRVQDAAGGKFPMVGERLERSEIRNQHQLEEYIKLLQERSGLGFNKNETVQQYLERANQQLAAGEIRSVFDGTRAAAGVAAEAGRVEKLQIDELARVTFRYDANNNVIGIQMRGAERSMNLLEGRKLLNGNFLDVLRAKYSVTRDLSRAYDAVNTTSMGVAFLRRGLGKLVELGRGESPEAKFLRERINGLIATAEKTHGDVFK